MGTRGTFGYITKDISNETLQVAKYVQFDSYIGGWSADLFNYFKNIDEDDYDTIKQNIKSVKIIDESIEPTPLQISRNKRFADLNVSRESLTDWYCLQRNLQDPVLFFESVLNEELFEMPNDIHFMNDSSCEYSYIIDFILDEFIIYEGDTMIGKASMKKITQLDNIRDIFK
jgi:hypothetical protein